MKQKELENKKSRDRISDLEVRIGQLNLEKAKFIDIIKQLEQKIRDRDGEIINRETWIAQLQRDIV